MLWSENIPHRVFADSDGATTDVSCIAGRLADVDAPLSPPPDSWASQAEADVNVIALIGERGREVREFLERDLDDRGRKKSVVIVATSNEPALNRVKTHGQRLDQCVVWRGEFW